MSIQKRLTLRLLANFLLIFIAAGFGVYLLSRAILFREFDVALRANALSLAYSLQRPFASDVRISSGYMRSYRAIDPRWGRIFFEIARPNGDIVLHSDSLGTDRLPIQFGTADAPEFWNIDLPGDAPGRAIGIRLVHRRTNGRDLALETDAIVVVAMDLNDLNHSLETLALALLGFGGLMLLCVGAVVPHVLKRELSPLHRLAEYANGITAKSLANRFSAEGLPDELMPIAYRLNSLLARLELSFDRERQFSSDVAHELRTPIAELRSQMEVALRWPDRRSADTDREALEIALQMEGIVNTLLGLLRSEYGQLQVDMKSVELLELLNEAWEPFAAKAQDKHLILETVLPPSAEIQSDPVLLRSIVTNLLGNAAEYTPQGGVIRIECEIEDHVFHIRVTNTTDNLEPADVPKLFERFWRKDKAREGSAHSGLGLALSQAVAQTLGYNLLAELTKAGELRMTLQGAVSAETAAKSSTGLE